MGNGYGFGAEGDWKTVLLVRAMKVISFGLHGRRRRRRRIKIERNLLSFISVNQIKRFL
jgi:hypothetical protein